jgi:hypothetical protein
MAIAELRGSIPNVYSDNQVNLPEMGLSIPIYNVRDLRDQNKIARHIADGAQMAMFGGVWGGFKGVRLESPSEEFFHRVKQGRPKEAKIAMMIPPSDSRELIDWTKVHPNARHLMDETMFESLWGSHGAYLHIIAPIESGEVHVPDVFETTPKDYSSRYPTLDPVSSSTACFFWRNDPYLEHLFGLIHSSSENKTFVGVTSLNRHGETPPYTYDEFLDHLKTGKSDPRDIHLVVRDPIHESSQALGSHTQVRLPLVDEEPVLKILRVGTLSPEGFKRATGLDVEVVNDAKDVRKNPGEDLDHHIERMNDEIRVNWASIAPQALSNH